MQCILRGFFALIRKRTVCRRLSPRPLDCNAQSCWNAVGWKKLQGWYPDQQCEQTGSHHFIKEASHVLAEIQT